MITLLVDRPLAKISAGRSDDIAAEVSAYKVTLQEKASWQVHGRKGEALARDVRSSSCVCGTCRIYHARRGDIRCAFVPKLPYCSEATVFTKIAQHSAPIVARLGNRGRVYEAFPSWAVISDEFAPVERGPRIRDVAPHHRVILAGRTTDIEATID